MAGRRRAEAGAASPEAPEAGAGAASSGKPGPWLQEPGKPLKHMAQLMPGAKSVSQKGQVLAPKFLAQLGAQCDPFVDLPQAAEDLRPRGRGLERSTGSAGCSPSRESRFLALGLSDFGDLIKLINLIGVSTSSQLLQIRAEPTVRETNPRPVGTSNRADGGEGE